MLQRFMRKFTKDESGAVLIYTLVTASVMFGMVGLATDVGMWYANKRDMQSAADAAAMTAVLEMARGATDTEMKTLAKEAAALNGYPAGDVTINNPPLSGPYQGLPGFM